MCFSALRQHKETEKAYLVNTQLETSILPALDETRSEFGKSALKAMQARSRRSVAVIHASVLKMVRGYFEAWRQSPLKTVRVSVYAKLYRNKIEQAFRLWKLSGVAQKEREGMAAT